MEVPDNKFIDHCLAPPFIDDDVIEVLKSSSEGVSQCYKEVLEKHPEASGKLTLKVAITPNCVQCIYPQQDELEIPELNTCISEAFFSLSFLNTTRFGVAYFLFPYSFEP